MNPSCHPTRRQAGWVLNTVVITLVLLAAAAILIPSLGRTTHHSPRMVASSNLRQIGQASLIYASEHQDNLPETDSVHAFAAALARDGGLNDASIWIAPTEFDLPANRDLSTVLTADRGAVRPEFLRARLAYTVVARGLNASHPSTTPIAWTRGLRPDGTWAKDSPYGGEGGQIVFLGGNVAFYRNLTASPFIRFGSNGATTTDVREALPPGAIIAEP
jgi:hypothetical protein